MNTRPVLLATTLAVLVGAVIPASASADVLLSPPSRSIDCGDDISVGVWYQSYSGGPRAVTLTIKSINGHTLARRRVRATTRWEEYWYTPRCGRSYTVVATGAGWDDRFPVRVRP